MQLNNCTRELAGRYVRWIPFPSADDSCPKQNNNLHEIHEGKDLQNLAKFGQENLEGIPY